MVELRQETGVQRSLTERLVRTRLQWAGHVERWEMTDYRRERQSYESRAGGDEGDQGWDGRTVLREMCGRQKRRKTVKRRQETEEGGKDYQMRRWRRCGQHLTPDKGKKRKRESNGFCFGSISTICFAAGDGAQRCRANWSKTGPQPNMGPYGYMLPPTTWFQN